MKSIALWLRKFDEPKRLRALDIINKHKPSLLKAKEASVHNAIAKCYLSINTNAGDEKYFLYLFDIANNVKNSAYENV